MGIIIPKITNAPCPMPHAQCPMPKKKVTLKNSESPSNLQPERFKVSQNVEV
ncbi:hypothetical protein H6G81_25245 [Scytonema hofmannii FACHB-248]|uniref:Uncharacterized protein n=1 Tax=Scytonema hofmannii FACHB-248 TaxID=1842502 RepID=A0ABR8GW54_9CYAN|nr:MULTISPECIES: hypothetical protein [Nostocales]MBD2607744.1 hypothetical protein [Scytonema hofmannii FACHB-248]